VTDIAVALRNVMLSSDEAVRRAQIDEIAKAGREIDADSVELDRRVVTESINRLRRELGGEPGQAAQVAARIAEGDLTGAIALRSGDKRSMMYEMEHMREHLGLLVGHVRRDAEQIASASAQIAAGNLDLSARTEAQAASLEETAAAMEQLSATVEQNSANADAANQLARQASAAAERGGQAVAAVTTRMQDTALVLAAALGMRASAAVAGPVSAAVLSAAVAE